MIKQSTSAGSPYALLAVTPGNGAHLQWGFDRDTAAGAYAFPSAWLKLKRVGSTLTASTSADGSSWTRVGSASVPMPAGVTIGLFVTSHAAGSSSTATFDHVAVTTGAGGTFTVNGGGADIWGGVDQFQYVHQPRSGDGSIVARVMAQENTDQWAKSGVMIKESTAAGAPYALLAVTPGNGARLQWNFNGDTGAGTLTPPSAWLRLSRSGNVITAATSPDGTAWTTVGTVTVTMAADATIGLFVTSHNADAVNTSTFDNVTVGPPAAAASAPTGAAPTKGGGTKGAARAGTATGAPTTTTAPSTTTTPPGSPTTPQPATTEPGPTTTTAPR